jgi:hypothetical protein
VKIRCELDEQSFILKIQSIFKRNISLIKKVGSLEFSFRSPLPQSWYRKCTWRWFSVPEKFPLINCVGTLHDSFRSIFFPFTFISVYLGISKLFNALWISICAKTMFRQHSPLEVFSNGLHVRPKLINWEKCGCCTLLRNKYIYWLRRREGFEPKGYIERV